MKTQLTKRTVALCLTAALTLSVNAAALFGGKEKAQPAEGAPTAQAVEIRTYRSIPYQAQFLAAMADLLSYPAPTQPPTVPLDLSRLGQAPRVHVTLGEEDAP